jgi:hypothetical protein
VGATVNQVERNLYQDYPHKKPKRSCGKMDYEKIQPGQRLSMRLPVGKSDFLSELVSVLDQAKSEGGLIDVKTLDILGLLWLHELTEEEKRKPRTLAERQYMRQIEDSLDKLFPEGAYKNTQDLNWALKREIISRLKYTLAVLHFGQLKDSAIRQINSRLSSEE